RNPATVHRTRVQPSRLRTSVDLVNAPNRCLHFVERSSNWRLVDGSPPVGDRAERIHKRAMILFTGSKKRAGSGGRHGRREIPNVSIRRRSTIFVKAYRTYPLDGFG